MTQRALLLANISRQFTQHIKVDRGSRGGTGSTKQKTLKILYQFMKKKILDTFQSINHINVSIHDCNCCKTGIKVPKCV